MFWFLFRGLILLPKHRVVLRRDLHNLKGKVALLSGGGSGHEPAHAGYVGRGMLSGCICGAVFTSCPSASILAAIRAVNKYVPSGVILIVKNYTGDRVNFGLAQEWALSEGIKVKTVVVAEDCALASADRSAGRRGLAGTVLAHKIGGAAAEAGASLDSTYDILERVVRSMGTIGVCLSPCPLPGSSVASFALDTTEMELGLGIHGEAGVRRVQFESCAATVRLMIEHMTDPDSDTHLRLDGHEDVVLLVNNLGGTSVLEMGVVVEEARKALSARGLAIKKICWGSFMTSLRMVGVSITVLKVGGIGYEGIPAASLLEMFPLASAGGFGRAMSTDDPEPDFSELETSEILPVFENEPELSADKASLLRSCVVSSCESLIAMKERLNELDAGCGDGDCGFTHARGAQAVLHATTDNSMDFSRPASVFQKIGLVCSEKMGGTSGAMYGVFMAAAARKMADGSTLSLKCLSEAVHEGVRSIKQYGCAEEGDRTMLDVLCPVTETLEISTGEEDLSALCEAVAQVAQKGAGKTAGMKANAGRASYVSHDRLANPDPGAVAVAQIISACANVLTGKSPFF